MSRRYPALVTVVLFIALLALAVRADSGTYPTEPYNGLQLTYSLTGASILTTKENQDWTRTLMWKGSLGQGALRIAGQARRSGGWPPPTVSATLDVTVEVDGKKQSIRKELLRDSTADFDLSVPIPRGARSGKVSVALVGIYNVGTRNVRLVGDFTAGGISGPDSQPTPKGNAPIDPKAKPNDPYAVKTSNATVAFIENIEGSGPVYIGRCHGQDLEPAQMQWEFIKPGARIILNSGDAVRLTGNTEVTGRYNTGAFYRLKGVGIVTFNPPKVQEESMKIILDRSLKMIGEFYFPKGGNNKFGIETDLAHTGIKGTQLFMEMTSSNQTIQVIEGSVTVLHKPTNREFTVTAGRVAVVTPEKVTIAEQLKKQGAPFPATSSPSPLDGTRWSVGVVENGLRRTPHPAPWIFRKDGTLECEGYWKGTWQKTGEGYAVTISVQGITDEFLVVFNPNGTSFTAFKQGAAYRYGVLLR
jgi:hypothetical protein